MVFICMTKTTSGSFDETYQAFELEPASYRIRKVKAGKKR